MAIAYHIDRLNHLRTGMTINLNKADYADMLTLSKTFKNLYGNGLSEHGMTYFSDSKVKDNDFPILTSQSLEIFAEYIRLASYSHLPSRMQCIFAAPDKESLSKWEITMHLKTPYAVYEIQYDESKSPLLDARWLSGGIHKDKSHYVFMPCVATLNIEKYFSGELSDDPLLELLIPLPVTVGKRIK